jgi:hypothetical protein
MKNNKDKMTYNLCSTERIYRNDTLMSFYFQPNKKIIKKFKPVDIDGERMKLNLETGEVTNYKKKDILNSYGASLRRTTICMNMLLAMNDFDWFWTLTFDRAKIDRTNDEEVFNCYKKYINNLSHKYPNFGYMCFPERHEDGCIHFHLLVNGITPKQMGLVNSGKVCCHWAKKKYNGILSKEFFEKTKHLHELIDTDGEPIYNVTSFAYGYTTVSKIVSRERCNTYVKKYVEKALGSTEVFKKRFYYSKNLNVPDIVKRIIGEDFTTPHNIEEYLKDNEYIKNAIYEPYINDYNILQIKIDNNTKQNISDGLLPQDFNLNDLNTAFGGQLKIEDVFY